MTRRGLLLALLAKGAPDGAIQLIEEQTKSGEVAAANLYVRRGSSVTERAFGKAPDANAVYLLASISKPMTATGVMLLADRGKLTLDEKVRKYIPEFSSDAVLIRHLLTHTSGLPDMLPENTELRKRHAPLPEFVARTCKTPLRFVPGSKVSYQSMGILLAAEIAQRITGQPFPTFLKDNVYGPLGLKNTSLGLGGRSIASTMQSQVTEHNDYDWNSPYWRNLASPWGGAHSTARDVATFVESYGKVLTPETAKAMITNQTGSLAPHYGLGWALHGAKLGKGCSDQAYGHGGSTGTLCWHDPAKDLTFVLLTTKPAEFSNKTLIRPVSDLVSQ